MRFNGIQHSNVLYMTPLDPRSFLQVWFAPPMNTWAISGEPIFSARILRRFLKNMALAARVGDRVFQRTKLAWAIQTADCTWDSILQREDGDMRPNSKHGTGALKVYVSKSDGLQTYGGTAHNVCNSASKGGSLLQSTYPNKVIGLIAPKSSNPLLCILSICI